MTITTIRKRMLRSSTALQALALITGGVATSAAFVAPAQAQDFQNVEATGRVLSTAGAPLSGATVTITGDQGETRTTTTDGSGSFSFPQLPAGTYDFTVAADGYDSFTETGVSVVRGNAANQFALTPAGAAAGGGNEIVVTAGRVRLVDFTTNTTGTSVQIGELAQRVPVARDITSVALLSPGSSAGDTAFGNLPSINGASVSENVYYLNGLNITSFRNGLGSVVVPFDLYESVDIKNGGMTAEFGRTTGGAIIATTKSGSNDYHGAVTFNWEPEALRWNAPNTYATDNDSRFAERLETIAELSGPIIKDRLFIYGMAVMRDVRTQVGLTSPVSSLPLFNAAGVQRTIAEPQTASACFYYPTRCTPFLGIGATGGSLSGAAQVTPAGGTRIVGDQVLVGNEFRSDRNHSPFYAVKVDAIPIDGHRFEGTYFITNSATTRNVFGTTFFSLASGGRYNPNTNAPGAYRSTTVFRGGGENYVLRYTGQFTDFLTLSGAYGKYKSRDTIESSTPNFPSISDERSGTPTSTGNVNGNADLSFEERTFYRGDVDLYVDAFGSHHFRAGYDREDLTLNATIEANGGYQLTYKIAGGVGAPAGGIDSTSSLVNGTQYVVARTFVSGGEFTSQNEAFYLQDTWQLFDDRLLLNLGVRNDRFTNINGAGDAFYESGNQWAPRLGFSFDVFGDRQTKLYGSFSRYFLPVAANTNLRLAGGELDYDTYLRLTGTNPDQTPIFGAPITTVPSGVACPAGAPGGATGAACVIRNDGSIPGTEETVAANLAAQSTDEFILGVEHRLGERFKVGLYGTYVKLNQSLEDISVDEGMVAYCRTQNRTEAQCRAVFTGVHQYALANPGADVVITANASGLPFNGQQVTLPAATLGYDAARRTYKAVTFTFDREFDGRWDLHGSYTWSDLKGNIEGGIRSDNSQTDSGLTSSFDLPGLMAGSYGFLPNHRRHNFKAYGSYELFDWLSFGFNGNIASPRKFGCLGRTPAYADYNSVQTGGIAGPNYGSTSAFYCAVANGQIVTNPVGFTVVNPTFTAGAAQNDPRNSNILNTPRASVFSSDWLYNLNLDAQVKLPIDVVDATVRVSVFNVFNQHAAIDFLEQGTATYVPNPVYGQPITYQQPRTFRIQLGLRF